MDLLRGIELRHAIPGRVRLRVPGIKGRPALAREVQRQLSGFRIVRRVEVSTVTGSVLVLYDPADNAAMAELGRLIIPGLDLDGTQAAAIQGQGIDGASPSLPDQVANAFRQINAKVEAATGGADLRVLLPATLFAGGILRMLVGKALTSPQWYDFLWFSFGTFFTLNRPPEPQEAATATARDREPGTAAVPVNGQV
jgi:hypothetical protein